MWRVRSHLGLPNDDLTSQFDRILVRDGELCHLVSSLAHLPSKVGAWILALISNHVGRDVFECMEHLLGTRDEEDSDRLASQIFAFADTDPEVISLNMCFMAKVLVIRQLESSLKESDLSYVAMLCRLCSFILSKNNVQLDISIKLINALFNLTTKDLNESEFSSICLGIASLVARAENPKLALDRMIQFLSISFDSALLLSDQTHERRVSFDILLNVSVICLQKLSHLLQLDCLKTNELVFKCVTLYMSEKSNFNVQTCRAVLRPFVDVTANRIGVYCTFEMALNLLWTRFDFVAVSRLLVELFCLLVPESGTTHNNENICVSDVFEADQDSESEFGHSSFLLATKVLDSLESHSCNIAREMLRDKWKESDNRDLDVLFFGQLIKGRQKTKLNRIRARYRNLFF
ncbi:hypothetical protein ACOME3_003262 [Neoechinorhynchus agilis]